MPRVYLDTSVWCRPFDEPSPRVDAERKAFLKILRRVYIGEFTVVGSIFLDIEVERIEGENKREAVKDSMNRMISERIEVVFYRILYKKIEHEYSTEEGLDKKRKMGGRAPDLAW